MTFKNAIYVADNFNREDFIVQGDDGNLIYEIGE